MMIILLALVAHAQGKQHAMKPLGLLGRRMSPTYGSTVIPYSRARPTIPYSLTSKDKFSQRSHLPAVCGFEPKHQDNCSVVTGMRARAARASKATVVAAEGKGIQSTTNTTLNRPRRFVLGDGQNIKKRLAAMGGYASLSYGWISKFLELISMPHRFRAEFFAKFAVYLGYYATMSSATRPFRIAASRVIAPVFDKIISYFRDKLKLPEFPAIVVTVTAFPVFVNVFFTISSFILGLCTVTWLTGIPLLPKPINKHRNTECRLLPCA